MFGAFYVLLGGVAFATLNDLFRLEYSLMDSLKGAKMSKLAGPEEVQSAIKELRVTFPSSEQVLTGEDVVTTYGFSENTYHPSHPHAVVVIPHSTEDVVKIVNIARKWRVPIVPYSGATSLEGHFSGVRIVVITSIFSPQLIRQIDAQRKHLRRHELDESDTRATR